MRERNWFQALDGDIDTSHLSYLHLGYTPFPEVESFSQGQVQFLH